MRVGPPAGETSARRADGSRRSYPAEIAVPGRSWRVPAGAARPDPIGGRTPAGNRRWSRRRSPNPAISLGPISTRRTPRSKSAQTPETSRGRHRGATKRPWCGTQPTGFKSRSPANIVLRRSVQRGLDRAPPRI